MINALMNLRDVKAASVGAALAALGAVALMTIHEGRVARARENVTVNAGEAELADPTTDGVDPAMAANANLVEQMRRYKERLEAIGAQKAATEKKLAEVE